MSPVFITQTGPIKSRDVQTQIRKHVMKDIGRSRRKPSRREMPLEFTLEVPDNMEVFTAQPKSTESDDGIGSVTPADLSATSNPDSLPTSKSDSSCTSRSLDPKHSPCRAVPAMPSIDRLWTGRMDPFVQYPIEMNYRALDLMDHIFDDRYGCTPPFRDVWLPVGMMDSAAFYQVPSNASLNLASLCAGSSVPETLESMRYHAKVAKMVTERISDLKEAILDGLLGAVGGFACYHVCFLHQCEYDSR